MSPPDIKPYMKVADVADIPYKDDSFDLVVSFNLLQHLERSKIKQAVQETVRVSRKYIFHKIITSDHNILYGLFHRRNFSDVSFFHTKYWLKLFSSFKTVTVKTASLLNPFDFIGARFLLGKKQNDS